MNKFKKALLATSLAGALVVSAGYGTYSWFTADSTANGQITNGTLSLGKASGDLFNHEKFAPSQFLMGNWTSFDNTGNLDQIIKVTYSESLNMLPGSLWNYRFQGYVFIVPTSYNPTPADTAYWENVIKTNVGGGNPTTKAATEAPKLPEGSVVKVIDSEKDASPTATKTAAANDTRVTAPGWELTLPVGFKVLTVFGVKLNETAGNDYQGAVYNASFKVNGRQTDAGSQY